MSQPDPGFTAQRLHNMSKDFGAVPYDKFPGMLSGLAQHQIQGAFRKQIRDGLDPEMAFQAFADLASVDSGGPGAYDILLINSAIALCTPCDDFVDIFHHICAIFDSRSNDFFGNINNTSRWILASNPLNPYLVFKNAPVEIWGKLGEAVEFIFQERHIKMAVLFDDVEMIEKIQEHAPDQFYNLLHKTMASVSFDPFSRIRAWAGLPQGISMAEIEIRIAIQHNVILQTNDFLPNQLSACEPRNADLKGFQEGLYSCDALNINAKDHLLRCLPRYPELVKRFPDLVIAPLKSSLKGDPFLIPQLIKDLNQAGVPLTDIYYLHVIGMSPGQYAHFTERESDLEQSFLTGLLMLSRLASGFEKSNIALKSILELVDPDLIDRYAKNDDQLRSAYAVTQDKKYLERMTDAAMDLQLSTDLGL